MDAFFHPAEAQARLIHHAGQWIGTPFVAHSGLKGAGVDCVHLCAEIYRECGFWAEYHFPAYRMDTGRHRAESQVGRWVEECGRFAAVDTPQPGDLLCFNIGRSVHHAGIFLHAQAFIHALRPAGAVMSRPGETEYQKRLTMIWRPLA